MSKRALVTGSNGFIGSFLAEELISSGYAVKCMLRKNSDTKWLTGLNYEPVYADFCDIGSLKNAVKEVDEIFHVGGIVRAVNDEDYYKINCKGTQNLVDAAKDEIAGISRFVYISSLAAWGPEGKGPVSHYGQSKREAEEIVKQIDICTIIRPVAVYGPRDADLLAVFKMANKGVFIKPGSINSKLSFIHIKDCINGIISSGTSQELFLSDGRDYNWDEIYKILEKTFEKKIIYLSVPDIILKSVGILNTALSKISRKSAKLNSDKVKEILSGNWIVPETSIDPEYNLETGFKDTYNWYKKMGWL